MKNNLQQWDELENQLMESYFDLEDRRRFLVIPYTLRFLPGFKGLGDPDKLAFLRLLEHSLDECRQIEDWEEFRIPMSEKVFETLKFGSVMDYQNDIFRNAFGKLLLSSKPWIVPGFTTSLFETTRLTDEKKLEAINYLRSIVAYTNSINSKEIEHNLTLLHRSFFSDKDQQIKMFGNTPIISLKNRSNGERKNANSEIRE